MVCTYCSGAAKRTVHILERGQVVPVKVPCEYCRCFSDGDPCPYAEHHHPDGVVVLSETTHGHHKDDDGRVKAMDKSSEKRIRYGDWEWRCRICYPRG